MNVLSIGFPARSPNMTVVLILSFFATALLYASVGFGGGSTYNALLVLSGADYRILPAIALACNIVVVSGGAFRFWREKLLPIRQILPFLVTSVPAAWLGGSIPLSETVFIGVLGCALLVSGLRLGLQPSPNSNVAEIRTAVSALPYITGGLIGFLSGLVGIGGGIFLAPVLYYLQWDTPRRIAAACSVFILANSISGLAGQITKLNNGELLASATNYWPLVIAVFVGGQLGSWAASQRLRPELIKRLTSILILYVACRLIYRWSTLVGVT